MQKKQSEQILDLLSQDQVRKLEKLYYLETFIEEASTCKTYQQLASNTSEFLIEAGICHNQKAVLDFCEGLLNPTGSCSSSDPDVDLTNTKDALFNEEDFVEGEEEREEDGSCELCFSV